MQVDNDKVIKYSLGNGDCFYLLFNYKTLEHIDTENLVNQIIKEDSKANGKVGVNYGYNIVHNNSIDDSVVEKAILKKQDLIYRVNTYKRLAKEYKARVRKVIRVITCFDKEIGYVLKRYYLSREYCTLQILVAEMFYSESKIKQLKRKGLQLYEKYYKLLYVNKD